MKKDNERTTIAQTLPRSDPLPYRAWRAADRSEQPVRHAGPDQREAVGTPLFQTQPFANIVVHVGTHMPSEESAMTTHTCGTCGQPWAVNFGLMRADPGETVIGSPSYLPVTDIYGTVTGHRWKRSGRWVSHGDPTALRQLPDNGELTWTYAWECGDHETSVQQPAYDVVLCTRCAPSRKDPAAALPGRSFPCACCGGNPGHYIARDPAQQNLPHCRARTQQIAG